MTRPRLPGPLRTLVPSGRTAKVAAHDGEMVDGRRQAHILTPQARADRSSGSPHGDFQAHRSPYPLVLMSWASGACQGAYSAVTLFAAVGPQEPAW
jgi:hypothetical protein